MLGIFYLAAVVVNEGRKTQLGNLSGWIENYTIRYGGRGGHKSPSKRLAAARRSGLLPNAPKGCKKISRWLASDASVTTGSFSSRSSRHPFGCVEQQLAPLYDA
jgi:hypothetical protein